MQVMEGDRAAKLKRSRGIAVTFRLPARQRETSQTQVRNEYIFRLLEEIGYDGWLGCEYRPADKTVGGLGWLRSLSGKRLSATPESMGLSGVH